jgi:hypothetical protein
MRKSQFVNDVYNDWEYLTDDEQEAEWGGKQPAEPRCRHCGSTDVRWRQQGERWVLFSLTPGVEHVCRVSANVFDDLDKGTT